MLLQSSSYIDLLTNYVMLVSFNVFVHAKLLVSNYLFCAFVCLCVFAAGYAEELSC